MAQLKDTIINGDLQVSNDLDINGELRILGGIHPKNADHSISMEGSLSVAGLATIGVLQVTSNASISGNYSKVGNIYLQHFANSPEVYEEIKAGDGRDENNPLTSLRITAAKVQLCKSTSIDDEGITSLKFVANSDRRLKENIIPYKCEKSILDLPIYRYDFIDGPKNQIGCLAQDLQQICPELVQKDASGFLSIQESKITYLLLQEVKKLREEIKELKMSKNSNNVSSRVDV